MRGSRFVYALGLLALGGAVVAQADIKYRVNGGSIVTPSFNNDRAVVNLGAITADAVVHVFDDATSSTTGPSDSLDGIELRADMSGAPGNLKIRLIVGNEDLETDFRPDVTANMAPGVIDFGVEATEAIVYVDTDTSDPDPTKLRDAVILALAVSGNVEGDLSVGRVWRVQASSTSSGNGFIRGNVLASAKDDLEFMPFPADPETRELGEYAINVVTAARGIQGLSGPMKRIESEVGSDSTGGGIARVLVTGASDEVGLQAHVISGKDITAIFTAGPIGEEAGHVNIYAQRQIEQIRTVTPGQELAEVNAYANVYTGVNAFGGLLADYEPMFPLSTDLTGDPSLDAPLGLYEVGGDIFGEIFIVNLAPVPGLPARKTGILAEGNLDAKVRIYYNLDYSKIIADQIHSSITIGLRMTGVIAEFNRETSEPTSQSSGQLKIGRVDLNLPDIPEPYEHFTSGMTGIDCTPVEMDVAKWWFETDDCEGGTFDSLIRVGIFGSINIDRVTLETTPGEHRKYMPRIEFQEVPSLTIGSMEAGVVWSGDLYEQEGLAADPQSFDPTDPEDHYAKVTTVVIGCVSPTADLWLRDFANLDVMRDMLGEIHVPELSDEFGPIVLPSYQIIRIGERLGNLVDDRQYLNDEQEWVCRCGSTTEFLTEVEACGVQAEYPLEDCVFPCPFEFEEDSPRGFAGGERLAGQGRIAVAQSLGLAGQIVINAANVHDYPDCGGFDHVDARSFWTGFVQVPPVSAGAPIILGPLTTTPGGVCCFSRQPVHAVAVEAYGGGDVGEVPFRIHYQSSSPSYMRSCSDAVAAAIFAVELADAADIEEPAITVRYDGPITFEASDDPPTPPSGRNIGVVDRWTGSEWIEALDLFAVALSTSNNREVLITPLNTDPAVYAASAQSVNFRFRPVRGDELDGNSAPIPYDSRLICHPGALLVTEGTVPVSSEMYHFTVMGEPGTPGPCDELLGDYNQDEIVDLTDLIDFLADWNPHLGQSVTPGTNGDFNGDGVVDLADLIEFLGYWNPQLGCPY